MMHRESGSYFHILLRGWLVFIVYRLLETGNMLLGQSSGSCQVTRRFTVRKSNEAISEPKSIVSLRVSPRAPRT